MSISIIDPNLTFSGSFSTRASTDYIALHHAEAPTCSVQDVHSWHLSNGWIGIGYHFFVRKDGSIYSGRPIWALGAHVSGMNNCSIGICAEGSYMTETMPDAQKKAIAELLDYLKTNFYPNAKIVGHREIGDSNCPGVNYPLDELKNYKNLLNGDDLTMTQYEELSAKIEEQAKQIREVAKKVEAAENEMIYNYIDENMPEWAREPVQWCVDKGIVAGTGDGLNLNGMKLWVCVVVYRVIKYVGKLINVKI